MSRPSMGKLYALRCFVASPGKNLHQMEYFCLSTISVTEFYRQLCTCLGIDMGGGKTAIVKARQEHSYYFHKKQKPLIIAIDEAQYLSSAGIKDVKMILNQGYDSLNCFTLTLCVEQYLNRILEKPMHEALSQRITLHYIFFSLNDFEMADYILQKLSIAGGGK